MKLALLLGLLLSLSSVGAQTLREKKIKKEMLERTDLLITKVIEARLALDKEDVAVACKKINELFELYPAHLTSIGTHMDLFDSKTVKIKNEALEQLIYMHQQSNVCAHGEGHEYLDMGAVDKKLKKIKKSLEKQKKTIKKSDTDYENIFHYEYEF